MQKGKKIFMKETKSEKFVRIAENRTNRIVDLIRVLGNCSNKSTYEFSEEDVKKIFSEIDKELKIVKKMFKDALKNEEKFKL